jgi:hypothetical protein
MPNIGGYEYEMVDMGQQLELRHSKWVERNNEEARQAGVQILFVVKGPSDGMDPYQRAELQALGVITDNEGVVIARKLPRGQ